MNSQGKYGISNPRKVQDSFEEYLGDRKYFSSSHFKEIAKSPLQLQHYIQNGTTESPAMKMGTAIHKILLEGPAKFQESYIYLDRNTVLPEPAKDYRTKANQIARDNFYLDCKEKGIICLEEDEYVRIVEIASKLYDNVFIRRLLSDGEAEVSHYFHCDEHNLDLKIRTDYISNKKPYFLDVKKTKDASREGFGKECYNHFYHVRTAFYLDYLNKFYEGKRAFSQAIILAVEEEPPYHYNIFVCDDDFIEVGRHWYRAYLWQMQKCVESGEWPGYEASADSEVTGLTTLSLPEYAKKHLVI